MVYHVVDSDSEGILIPKYNVAERVANENHINACLVNDGCRMIVIGSQHADRKHALAVKQFRNRLLHRF